MTRRPRKGNILKSKLSEADRQSAVLEQLRLEQFITVSDIVELLAVSPATVRRDFAKLDRKKLARVVHGGITGIEEMGRARPYLENELINVSQKQAIGVAATRLCNDGDTIFIHGGSTCSIFARSIGSASLNIITNSIPVAQITWENPRCNLRVIGGDLHRETGALYSPQALTEEFFVSKYFVGALGVGQECLYESDPLLVRVSELVSNRASEVVVLADSSKFNVQTRLKSLELSKVSSLITDDRVSDRDVERIESAGVNVVVAAPLLS